MVYLGSNTTIIADGATIVMTATDKGILSNKPDRVNYEALKKCDDSGGTWKITDKVKRKFPLCFQPRKQRGH